jgi:hypothetical protein
MREKQGQYLTDMPENDIFLKIILLLGCKKGIPKAT